MERRERWGQVSIASAAPAGDSAPIPIPNALRNSSNNQKLGARPASNCRPKTRQSKIINGLRRPIRSASQPDAVGPTSLIHKVNVKTTATSVTSTPECSESAPSEAKKS